MSKVPDELMVLEMAINGNDVTGVTQWIENHPHPRDSYNGLWKLLIETGRRPNSQIFDLFLKYVFHTEARLDPKEMDVELLFYHLLQEGTVSCLGKLIDGGCDLNVCRHGQGTPLTFLMKKPYQTSKIKYLVSRGSDINKLESGDVGFAPLHYAAGVDENLEIITTLLNLGADVNKLSRRTRETPLHIALQCQNTSTLEFLLQNGANPRIRSLEGETVLEQAVHYPHSLRIFLKENVILPEEKDQLLFRVLSSWDGHELISLRLLLETGGKCSRDVLKLLHYECTMFPCLAAKLSPVDSLLDRYAFHPRSLLDLCCFKIRDTISSDFCRCVEDLPIPEIMKSYVKLEHYLRD